MRQSERKLRSAMWDLKGKFFEDACFSAQQAAELAVKALLERRGTILRGHSIYTMIKEVTKNKEMLERARILDQYYIPTRYPNGFDVGAPMDYYTKNKQKGQLNMLKISSSSSSAMREWIS